MQNKRFSTKNIAGIAVFTALSFILYLPVFEIPLFVGTPYKLDFSNVFVLLGGFMYGPIGGVLILVIKELLHLPLGGTGGIGELANILIGLSFILFPTILYKFKKGLKTVIVSLLIACFIQTGVGILANKYILLPFFRASEFFESWFWVIVLLNAIKSVSGSLFSILFYKKLSFLFKKINLQDDKTDNQNLKNAEISKSALETEQIAYRYASSLKKGDVVLLTGDLGAGKTRFVKGIAKYFKIEEPVLSPTYSYLNVYGNFIYHYDCYRLSCGEDALNLGLTDYFNGDNICFIEWSENIKDVLPLNCKTVKIEKINENTRRIIL